MPCLKRCCCCVTLRTGGITMGIMTLALSLFSIIPMVLLMVNKTFWARVITYLVKKYSIKPEDSGEDEDGEAIGPQSVAFWGTVSEAFGNTDESKLPPDDDEQVHWLASVILVFSIVCIILLVVYLVCSLCLILGAAKGRRWFLLPWIVATFLLLLAYLGGVCLSIWLFGGRVEILLLLAFAVVETAIGFYLWVCIVSLFQHSSKKMLPVMEIVLPQMASNVPAFLGKLWKMVDDPDTDYLISWSDEGNSFIIHNQAEFAQALLPYYYKHSNMASFVRQLNMYGFHKVVGVDSGGLKSERQEEMEFAHPCFLRGNENLLDQIRRKVANKQTAAAAFVPSIRQEKVNEVLTEVSQLKDKQEDMDTKLDTMKKENEALWREVVSLRQKHSSQQKIVNKLIQFLMSVVQPRMGTAVKRRYQPQLAIEDAAGQSSGLSPAKLARKNDGSADESPSEAKSVLSFGAGPVIQDVTHDSDNDASDNLFGNLEDSVNSQNSVYEEQPRIESPMSPLSAAMNAVDPLLVSPGITVNTGPSSSNSNSNTTTTKANTTKNTSLNDKVKTSLSTAMMAPPRRPILQREISEEDFDLETTLMQKDLDNLKEMLSGQITFDSNILSNLFNPEEPLASYFAGSNNDFMNQKLPLELEGSANSSGSDPNHVGMLDQPSLFELADIDDDTEYSNPERDNFKSDNVELIDMDDDFSASLNTPLVHFDTESPLLSQIRSTGRKLNKKIISKV